MAWDQTKPVYKSPLISSDIRDNWSALYTILSVDHDFATGTHKSLVLPANGLTVGTTLKLTSNKVLVGYSVDQDGTSLLQVNGTGYFTYGLKFGDGTTQTTASPSTSYVASTYAPLVSPSLTGVPLAPTAAQNTNTTQIATTAYYIGQAGTATPLMAGIASVGTSYLFARQDHKHPTDTSNFSATAPLMDGTADAGSATTYARSNHVHPTDTSRAPLVSPNFSGVPLAPTASVGQNDLQIVNTACLKANIDALVNAAPGTLDTLNEIATALGNDPNFATTITNSIASKFAIAGGSFTGSIGIISGSTSSPSLYISGDTNTGFYAPAADTLGVTLGGTSKVIFSSAGDTLQVTGSVNSTGGYIFPDGKAQLKAFLGLQNNGTDVALRNRINVVGPFVSFSDDSTNDVSTITISSNQGVPTVQYFSGNNSQTVFTLSDAPISKDYATIHIGGTYVPKSAYSISGTTLTFTTAPTTGVNNIEVEWITPLPISQLTAGSVTSTALADNIALRGTPTAPTLATSDNSTSIATTAFVYNKMSALGTLSTQNSTDVSVTKIGVDLGSMYAPSVYFNGDSNTGIFSPLADTLAVSVAGSEAWRTTATGKFLLGTTTNNGVDLLQVNGSIAFNGGALNGLLTTTTYGQGLKLKSGNTYSYVTSFYDTSLNDCVSIGVNLIRSTNTTGTIPSSGLCSADIVLGSGTASGFIDFNIGTSLNTLPSRLMRLTSLGDLGLGISTPVHAAGYTTLSLSNADTGSAISLNVGSTEFGHIQAWSNAFSIAATGASTDLLFQANGSTCMRIKPSGNVVINSASDDGINVLQVGGSAAFNTTSHIKLPIGTTAQRPTGQSGYLRYNSDLNKAELYTGSAWGSLLGDDTFGKTNTWPGSQRGTVTTDNDLSFDMNVGQNFSCTPTGSATLTFTNITAGQSGFIKLVNGSNYTISKHSSVKCGASLLATVSVTGTYLLNYWSDGTDVFVTTSGSLS